MRSTALGDALMGEEGECRFMGAVESRGEREASLRWAAWLDFAAACVRAGFRGQGTEPSAVAAEVVEKLFVKDRELDPGNRRDRAYVATAARNTAISSLRRARNRRLAEVTYSQEVMVPANPVDLSEEAQREREIEFEIAEAEDDRCRELADRRRLAGYLTGLSLFKQDVFHLIACHGITPLDAAKKVLARESPDDQSEVALRRVRQRTRAAWSRARRGAPPHLQHYFRRGQGPARCLRGKWCP